MHDVINYLLVFSPVLLLWMCLHAARSCSLVMFSVLAIEWFKQNETKIHIIDVQFIKFFIGNWLGMKIKWSCSIVDRWPCLCIESKSIELTSCCTEHIFFTQIKTVVAGVCCVSFWAAIYNDQYGLAGSKRSSRLSVYQIKSIYLDMFSLPV